MNIEKIKINGHYVYVDKDAEIKEGDYILMNCSFIRQCEYIDGYMVIDTTQGKHHNSVCFKIIAASPELNLEGVPSSYVEWLAEQNFPVCDVWNEEQSLIRKLAFIKGYQTAEKELPTWDDVRKAIEMARTLVDGKNEFDVENILGSSDGTYGIEEKYSEEEIIKIIKN